MTLLNKTAILAADDLKKELVKVPEWGGSVYIRAMTGEERDAFEVSFAGDKKEFKNSFRARLAASCICDEGGALLFTESDISELAKKSAAALDRICARCTKINAITKDDIEDLEKN